MSSFSSDDGAADDRVLERRMFEAAAAIASGVTAGQRDALHTDQFDRQQQHPSQPYGNLPATSTSASSSPEDGMRIYSARASHDATQPTMNAPSVFAQRRSDVLRESGSSFASSGVGAPSSSSMSISAMEDRWANNQSFASSSNKKQCTVCGTTESPEWRKGSDGRKSLCNACGLRLSRTTTKARKDAERQSMANEVAANGGTVPASMQRKIDDDRQKRQVKAQAVKAIRKASTSSALPRQEQEQPPQQQQQQQQHQHQQPQRVLVDPIPRQDSHPTTFWQSHDPPPRGQQPPSSLPSSSLSHHSEPFTDFQAAPRPLYAPQAPYVPPYGHFPQATQPPSLPQATLNQSYPYPYHPPPAQPFVQSNMPYDEFISTQTVANFLSTPAFDPANVDQQNASSSGSAQHGGQRYHHHYQQEE